ncbi:MMPL family transporter [Nocardia terpenica]|uniref:MMPL family transporter n=1 Tax=Nocardia terpenica TaxID=455432 RepID=UPI001EEB067F|nr:MMPL family transporter [Nocardia terpenica]
MLFTGLARLALRAPRRVLGVATLLLLVAGVFGLPIAEQLPAGGYDDPRSEWSRSEQALARDFGVGGISVVFTVAAPGGVDSPPAQAAGRRIADTLQRSGVVDEIISYWSVPQPFSAPLVSADRHTGLVTALVAGSDGQAPVRARALAAELAGTVDGVRVQAGGQAVAMDDINRQSRQDLIRIEALAIPFTFLVLVWIFGSAVAALLPLLISAFSIGISMALLRALNQFTDVSIFALNITVALGMALAVDYSLFIVSRYREEVAQGAPREQALRRTMATAGRTVTYSALTLILTVSMMLIFPMYFMKSIAYAGLIGVSMSLLGALVVAPALLMLLGDRVDSADLRGPVRRLFGRAPHPPRRTPEQTRWYRIAGFAVDHAVPVAVLITALFVLLGLPALGIKLGYPDDRVLPDAAAARQVGDVMRAEFRQNVAGTVRVVLPDGIGTGDALDRYAAALSRVPDVTGVSAPDGIYVGGNRLGTVSFGSGQRGDAAYLSVATSRDPYSVAGKDQLAALKSVPAPAPVLFGGLAQRDQDNVAGIVGRVPLVLALVALVTFVLMFLFTGSLVLPIKALIMNLLALGVCFGAMVWIFQDGHLGALGTLSTGATFAAMPPLIACTAFGLSMDYELFVLSRMREEWLRGKGDTRRWVAMGLGRTGAIVTAAATVMAVVFCAIIASQVSFMRAFGLGLTLTVLMDAFLIRILLIPAFMRLLGRANWWAPGPLAHWHTRIGLREGEAADDQAVGESRLPATDSSGMASS